MIDNNLFPEPKKIVWRVSELNRHVRVILEQTFPLLWVSGEISNLKRYPSGHWYFSLKDDNAQVRCVMFRHKNMYLDWMPQDGAQVEAQALITLYEARGEFQLTIEQLRRAGLGVLFETFERLKTRLQQEGLFNPEYKQLIPPYPQQIGIITSTNTAALRDVLTTLQRRLPSLPVVIYPAPVQGKEAASAIVTALQIATQRSECDVLILCRGGGSIEDLWAFNEEIVARAIAACPIPIVTGIGHETDFTIADFVADMRAPTPTGAAQLAAPDRQDILHRLQYWQHRLQQAIERNIERRMQTTDLLTHRLIHPGERIRYQLIHLSQLHNRLLHAWSRQLEVCKWRIEAFRRRIQFTKPDINTGKRYQQELAARLQRAMVYRLESLQVQLIRQQQHLAHLDPKAVLERGYSITYTAGGEILQDSQQIHTGDNVQIVFAKGSAKANITETNK
ncbi:Exodeoxyribonuclease VII large subunit [Nitrosomonas eutropha]|uniref:exodeoxyribonuclease VII large subunit n=1 Tax=Nitrosomonas eutropha TaxID=916 RepID=UPI00088277BA|nr:exodeoxyribonuclease VII large subunit [Nitrosomonas eutropha]SCX00556.1 Exodeoxyribonuclease VII large subunit [Nitrosomonas eutropha]